MINRYDRMTDTFEQLAGRAPISAARSAQFWAWWRRSDRRKKIDTRRKDSEIIQQAEQA